MGFRRTPARIAGPTAAAARCNLGARRLGGRGEEAAAHKPPDGRARRPAAGFGCAAVATAWPSGLAASGHRRAARWRGGASTRTPLAPRSPQALPRKGAGGKTGKAKKATPWRRKRIPRELPSGPGSGIFSPTVFRCLRLRNYRSWIMSGLRSRIPVPTDPGEFTV